MFGHWYDDLLSRWLFSRYIDLGLPVIPSAIFNFQYFSYFIYHVDSDSIKRPCLLKSKLYIKIIGLLYKINQDVISPDFIEDVLKETYLFKGVVLASKPRIIKVSPKSDMAVVWIDIWDSQSGSSAKNIINRYFNIGRFITTIKDTNINPGVL